MHIQEIHYVGAKLDLQWDLSLNPNVRSGLEEMHSQVQDIFPHGEERFHVSDRSYFVIQWLISPNHQTVPSVYHFVTNAQENDGSVTISYKYPCLS